MGETVTTASNWVIDSTLLETIQTTFMENLAVILPVALGIFAVIFSIKLLPRLISRFSK